ncbi:MAG: AAA family ATPase [Thermoproteota archaeon]|nr:MAG: AAA family ATPase [Candidatus Korarchaeota archaeon]
MKPVKVLVAPLPREYSSRGLARLDVGTAAKLKVDTGDYIMVEGRAKAAAIVVLCESSQPVVELDPLTRENAGVKVGEEAVVRRVSPSRALRLVVKASRPASAAAVRSKLAGFPLIAGNKLRVALPKGLCELHVLETTPEGPVVADRSTAITLVDSKPGAKASLSDLGGLGPQVEELLARVIEPVKNREAYERVGAAPPRGVLIYGPPGTGKTLLARALACELGAVAELSGPELAAMPLDQAREALEHAYKQAVEAGLGSVLLDDVDRLSGELARLAACLMDRYEPSLTIATAASIDSVDQSLRRSGRLEVEVELPVPDRKAREEILEVLARDLPLASELYSYRCPKCGGAYSLPGVCSECRAELEPKPSLARVAEAANGYVGADLAAVCREAAVLAARAGSSVIRLEHFMEALKLVRPTATREIRTETPRVSWSDVGGLSDVIQQLREAVEWPLKHPEVFERMGVKPPKGVLLYGPPGTGKTLLAKAAASESGASFIAVKGPELLSKWVGESEKAIREVFRKARQYSPSIVFFDEIDALAPRRSDSGSRVSERVVAQLLTEMDGIEELEGVVVMAATNRPDLLDPALLRPGRLDRVIQVPLPDEEGRLEILRIHTREMPLAPDVDLAEVAKLTHGASGADLKAVCIEAAILALRESLEAREVRMEHFMEAVKKVMASRK